MEIYFYILIGLVILLLILLIIVTLIILGKNKQNNNAKNKLDIANITSQIKSSVDNSNEVLQKVNNANYTNYQTNLKEIKENFDSSIANLNKNVNQNIQSSVSQIFESNFRLVTQKLNDVNQVINQIQNVTNDIVSLNKILSNNKNRGVFGEVLLKQIVSDVLTTNQYKENVITVPNSHNFVEMAVLIPNSSNQTVYLPIDSKFPLDAYTKLVDAYSSNDKHLIEGAKKEFILRIASFAKDIRLKYIQVPYTMQFGIMFLPIESCYLEVCKLNISEEIYRKYQVIIAGPTSLLALLNSLALGFSSYEIQKRSDDVRKALYNFKSEFEKMKKNYEEVSNYLDKAKLSFENLIGVRTRQMERLVNKYDSNISNFENDKNSDKI